MVLRNYFAYFPRKQEKNYLGKRGQGSCKYLALLLQSFVKFILRLIALVCAPSGYLCKRALSCILCAKSTSLQVTLLHWEYKDTLTKLSISKTYSQYKKKTNSIRSYGDKEMRHIYIRGDQYNSNQYVLLVCFS